MWKGVSEEKKERKVTDKRSKKNKKNRGDHKIAGVGRNSKVNSTASFLGVCSCEVEQCRVS